ncbi:MAG: hemerythrin domain-containing protein [Acidobacteriota bacterium]
MTYTSDILVEEHDVIERMLKVVRTAAERLEEGDGLPAEAFLHMVDFIQNFADRCHHAKEENILFKLMEKRGFSLSNGPIGVMLQEHEEGRRFTRNMKTAALSLQEGDHLAKREIINNAHGYVDLLSQHIFKENNILYPMANHAFTPEDQQYLAKEFERVETEAMGEGVHEKYHHLVLELEKRLMMK